MRSITIVLLAIFTASLLLAGCARDADAPETPDPTDAATYAGGQSYTVRGVISQLPGDGPPPTGLKIHHEHIPGFIGKTGEVFVNRDGTPGMRAMNMEFPNVSGGVPVDTLAVGDKVEFTFLVRWDETDTGDRIARWLVTEITPLPPETEISFENKTGP